MQEQFNKILDHKFSPFKGPGGRAYLALFNICFFWGTTWNVLRLSKDYIHPLQIAGIRQVLAGSIFILFFLFRKHRLPTLSQLWQALYSSIFLFVLSNGLTSWGMKYVSGGLGAIIGALSPLFIPLMAILMGEKQKLGWHSILGLILGAMGVVVIFYEHLHDLLNPEFRWGLVLLFIAVLAWSFGTILVLKQQKTMNGYYNTGWQMLFAGIIMLIWSGAMGYSKPVNQISPTAWMLIVYLVLFGSVVTFISYVYALKKLPVAQVSIYAYINPLVAILIGWLFMNEKLSFSILVGTLIIFAGVYLVNRKLQKKAQMMVMEKENA